MAWDMIWNRDRTVEEIRDLNVNVIAERIGVSPSYLSRVYRMEQGVNLSESLFNRRMKMAFGILGDRPEYSVAKVAQEVGYESTSHFIQAFKKYWNATPVEIRERHLSHKRALKGK